MDCTAKTNKTEYLGLAKAARIVTIVSIVALSVYLVFGIVASICGYVIVNVANKTDTLPTNDKIANLDNPEAAKAAVLALGIFLLIFGAVFVAVATPAIVIAAITLKTMQKGKPSTALCVVNVIFVGAPGVLLLCSKPQEYPSCKEEPQNAK